MRIIAGTLKGRIFNSPGGNKTHPMSEKIRGALFSALGDITGLDVLDTYSGTGALSFEALSRGANYAVAVDMDRQATRIILESSNELGLTAQLRVVRANISSWSDNNQDKKFDIVFCDPPYDQVNHTTLRKLDKHVKTSGLIIYSLPPNAEFEAVPSLKKIQQKKYGDALLAFYRKTS